MMVNYIKPYFKTVLSISPILDVCIYLGLITEDCVFHMTILGFIYTYEQYNYSQKFCISEGLCLWNGWTDCRTSSLSRGY